MEKELYLSDFLRPRKNGPLRSVHAACIIHETRENHQSNGAGFGQRAALVPFFSSSPDSTRDGNSNSYYDVAMNCREDFIRVRDDERYTYLYYVYTASGI